MLKHEKISEKSIRNPIIPLVIKCFNFPLSHEMQTLNTAIIQYPYDNSKSFFASRGKDSNSDITIVSSYPQVPPGKPFLQASHLTPRQNNFQNSSPLDTSIKDEVHIFSSPQL